MQQNLTERKRCKFNSVIEMYLYGHNWMVLRYGYEHIILVYVSFTLNLEFKYRIVYFVYLHTTNQMIWNILKGKIRNLEMFQYLN